MRTRINVKIRRIYQWSRQKQRDNPTISDSSKSSPVSPIVYRRTRYTLLGITKRWENKVISSFMIKLIANRPANKILLSHPFALFPSVCIRSAWSLQNMRRVLHACVEFYVTKSACTRQFWQRISKVSRSVIYIIRTNSFITSAPGAQIFF